jgi:hypothetical protein
MLDIKLKKNSNSPFIIIILIGSFLFQITILKHIWSIENLSRIFNIFYLILTLSYSTYSLFTLKTKTSDWLFYIIPGWLIIFGITINFLINYLARNPLFGHLGILLPWTTYLMILTLVAKEKLDPKLLWKYSYYIMLSIIILGLVDYFLIYYSGYLAKSIETPYGIFLKGNFSILHKLNDGKPHFRFYASFAEPGSLGMMILPFISYSFLHKKYIGLTVLGFGLYFTYSLGSLMGLVFLIILFIFFKPKKRNKNIFYFFSQFLRLSLLIIILIFVLLPNFTDRYEKKGISRTTRIESVKNGIANIPEILFNSSFGFFLENTTAEAQKNNLYSGSNFIPINYLKSGGFLAFIGFCTIIFFSIYDSIRLLVLKRDLKMNEYVVATSLLCMVLFLFQRQSLWDTSLFALLFFPYLIKKNDINYSD